MRRSVIVVCWAVVCGLRAVAGDVLHDGFRTPPDEVKPWCYWWWVNGHVDKETITADLEAMKRLGFGGLLMFDSRGYWDDENHVVNPKAETAFMSEPWQEHVTFAIREAARLGLKFTMNMSSSGGKLDGPWEVGGDAPKRLVYKFYADTPEGRAAAEKEEPGLPHYTDIAVQTVTYTGPAAAVDGVWRNGGDGVYSMEATSGKRLDAGGDGAARVRCAAGTPGARTVLVRFGYTVLPGHEHDVDVLDPAAITGHYLRFQGTLQKKIPGLVGRDKTLAALYSVSWEGTMPTWTHGFEAAFKKYAGGRDIAPDMALLAGFTDADRAATAAFMRAYRRVRNDMFRDNFYGTMRDLSHARGIDWYSESGGPWQRKPQIFREADQIAYLGVNDIPQGEFWPFNRGTKAALHGRYHVRAAAAAAHLYGRARASAEAFTHMDRHWSVDPAFLKPVGDECFIGGINHLVWHTFTCSPKKFGVPGAEYFAGSHINRNVTWHPELAAFVTYLGRCQWMLRQGESVQDFAVYAGDRPYQHWGLYLDKAYDGAKAKLPKGYSYDIVNDDALLNILKMEDGKLALPSGITYGALVLDPEFPDEPLDARVLAKIEAFRRAGLKVFTAAEADKVRTLGAPDSEGPFLATHRRDGATDIYFVSGSGMGTMTLRETSDGRSVEVWDAVTGARAAADYSARADGRTAVRLNLPEHGSAFVVFRPAPETRAPAAAPETRLAKTVAGPWRVSFAFHDGITAAPPADVTLETLRDFTTFGTDGDAASTSVRYFAGAATYRARVTLTADEAAQAAEVSVGALPSGLATVKVNGTDLGTVWCAPWTAAARGAFKAGENEIEIRYVNNWHNRLLGDCFLDAGARVTRSTLRYWNKKREGKHAWALKPTVYSGYSSFDPLQPSGVLGPVEVRLGAGRADALTAAPLAGVRLKGHAGKKFDTFARARIFSDFAKNTIFQEAEDAFAHPDDDVFKAPVGMWKGEFWGKLMISACRAAEYAGDAELKAFLHDKARKLITFQHADGYLGTYTKKEFVLPADLEEAKKTMGWPCTWNWNLWCRKYTLWGLLACWRLTGDRALLDAADRAMAQQIAMLKKLDLKLCDTGTSAMRGLPPCSVLKPLVWLYQDTGKKEYLDYAAEIVGYWDEDGNRAPQFFRHLESGAPMQDWYPGEEGLWAKAYEMMSCLDGVVEYARVTGSRRAFAFARRMQEEIWRNELNPLFSVGYNDQFTGAARHLNGITEPCDAVHWMRFNHDLLLATGEAKYADAIEQTFENAFLAGVCRDGRWGARGVRSAGRHLYAHGQSGMTHQHCCVNNMPRGFMDAAQTVCLRDAAGRLYVALYDDAEVAFDDGAAVTVAGGYPVGDTVRVTVRAPRATEVRLRVPAWCARMTVDGAAVKGTDGWHTARAGAGETVLTVAFDMTPRLVDNLRAPVAAYERTDYRRERWGGEKDMLPLLRTEPAATLMRGPLLLAKAERAGTPRAAIFDMPTMNRQGWRAALEPLANPEVRGAWRATFTKGDATVSLNVCDYASCADEELPAGRTVFSIWF